MGIKFVKEGNACELCGKQNTEVGKMTHYKKYGHDDLLCKNCIKQIEIDENLQCPKCGKVVGLEGITEYEDEEMCIKCMKKITEKGLKREQQKQFLKTNWFKWVMIGLTIIAIVVGAIVGSSQ